MSDEDTVREMFFFFCWNSEDLSVFKGLNIVQPKPLDYIFPSPHKTSGKMYIRKPIKNYLRK